MGAVFPALIDTQARQLDTVLRAMSPTSPSPRPSPTP
jgi:hypothetical protein